MTRMNAESDPRDPRDPWSKRKLGECEGRPILTADPTDRTDPSWNDLDRGTGDDNNMCDRKMEVTLLVPCNPMLLVKSANESFMRI